MRTITTPQRHNHSNRSRRHVTLRTALLVTAFLGESGAVNSLRGSTMTSTTTATVLSRRNRFPSVEERVKVYMSNWYVPPCDSGHRYNYIQNERNLQVGNWTFTNTIKPDTAFWLDEAIVMDCARSEEQFEMDQNDSVTLPTEQFITFRHNMRMYCHDVVEVFEILHHLALEDAGQVNTSMPILLQFGDMKHSHDFGFLDVPHIKKFRSATNNERLDDVTSQTCIDGPRKHLETTHGSDVLQPIVWKLATSRHFKFLPDVYKYDTPWDQKKNKAVWRGQLTGALDVYKKKRSPRENCENMRRCRLVLESANSTLIDAKLTTTRKRLPDEIDGVEIVGEALSLDDLMQFKALVMLEGNDVASGLKWALLSQSVVLMQTPKHTSWAMEELLQPWIHYIPLNENASDVDEKMQWIVDHDSEARLIAERSTLWMEDLVFHPDAARDDRLVKEEIIRRYRAHFVSA